MEERLPDDLVRLVWQHHSAMVVQQRWWRCTHYGHARRACWPEVRAHLRAVGAWPTLVAFPQVRREWRSEPLSWLQTDACMARVIRREAADGLWGAPSRRLCFDEPVT